MGMVASFILVLLGVTLPPSPNSDESLKPQCECRNCGEAAVVATEMAAEILGEAYLRMQFGDKEVTSTKPIVVHYRKRKVGDYWAVFGAERSPTSGQYNTVLIDRKTGCLLFSFAAP